MMDTYNLAWKIAHVLKNISRPEILDTYEQERRQVALDLISFDYKLSRLWSKDGKSPSDTQDQEEYSQAFRSFIKQGW